MSYLSEIERICTEAERLYYAALGWPLRITTTRSTDPEELRQAAIRANPHYKAR